MKNDDKMALTAKNYRLMLAGLAIIVLGFVLMSGGKSPDAETFNYGMFSFRRITLAPILVVGGFALEIYAIIKRYK